MVYSRFKRSGWLEVRKRQYLREALELVAKFDKQLFNYV